MNRIRDRGVTITDRTIAPVTGEPVVAVHLRLDGPDGQMTGFLSMVLPEERLNAVAREEVQPSGWFTIGDGPEAGSDSLEQLACERQARRVLARTARPRGPGVSGPDFHCARRRHGDAGCRPSLLGHRLHDRHHIAAGVRRLARNAALARIGLVGLVLLLCGVFASFFVVRQVSPVETTAAETARRLRLAEARYRSLWSDTPEGLFIVTVTEEGRFVFEGLNPVHARATGLTFDGIAGKEPEDCLPRDVAEAVLQRYRHCVETGVPEIYDEVLDLPGGRRHWQTSLSPVRDPDTGRICLLVGTARDVTEDREARAGIEQSRSLLQATLDALSAHIAILDGTGTIIAVNQAWHRFAKTGEYLTPDHGIGRNYLQVCRDAIPSDPQVSMIMSGLLRDSERRERSVQDGLPMRFTLVPHVCSPLQLRRNGPCCGCARGHH